MCRLAWQRPRPPWHASQRPRHASQRPRHALQRPRPSRHALVVHYSLGFTAYKAASGGVFLRGRCQAYLGVAKQAYTS